MAAYICSFLFRGLFTLGIYVLGVRFVGIPGLVCGLGRVSAQQKAVEGSVSACLGLLWPVCLPVPAQPEAKAEGCDTSS